MELAQMLEHFIRRGFADEDEQRRFPLVQIGAEFAHHVVVEPELDFEGAIGHAPTALQEPDDLLEHLIKLTFPLCCFDQISCWHARNTP